MPASLVRRNRSLAQLVSLEPRLVLSDFHGESAPSGTHGGHHETQSNGGSHGGSLAVFDFADAYYRANGVDPTKIAGRPSGTGTSVAAPAPDANHRGIRVTALNGMHDDGGKANFFAVLGTIQATAFTSDAAGTRARQIADQYVAYIFPKAGGNLLSPAVKRQDELIPLNGGYFSNDPLQVWREAFVNFVPGSMTSGNGKKTADDLTRKNGLDADGTPMIRTLSDLDKARQAGIVTVALRNNDGSQGAPWFFCATFKDLRGTFASDTTLTVVHNANGTVASTSQDIQSLFDSLKQNSSTSAAELLA